MIGIPLLLANPSVQAEILDFQVRVLTLFHQGTRLATSCDENTSGQQR
jgi:hypothetical protein